MGAIKDDLLETGAELRETHISRVFLTDRDAYKVKKPVSMGFLDFSTLEKRREACEAELELNRRLAEDVYVAVVPVRRDASGYHRIEGEGDIVDWAVHMRRLADSERADRRLEDDRLNESHLERLATRLARFHDVEPPPDAAPFGSIAIIRENVEENFQQVAGAIDDYLEPRQVAEVENWQRAFLVDQAQRFEQRVETGRIRDGHGDLRLEHVYIDDAGSPTVIDCIEFNDRFRWGDVCADVVFFAMDLAWHRRVDLAERFLAIYAREANDYDLYPLVNFYESYRAFVRGKIASIVASDPSADHLSKERASDEARRYFLLALASERRSLLPPSVVAVVGQIASGKTTVAERIARMSSAPAVDADRTRKHLAGVGAQTPLREAAWQSAYSPGFTETVYSELFRRAESVLVSRRPVVLDASFRAASMRTEARALAERHGVPFVFVECRVDPPVSRARLRERERTTGVSDGRLEILDAFVSRFEPVEELPDSEHVVLDTSRPIDENVEILRGRLTSWPDGFTG